MMKERMAHLENVSGGVICCEEGKGDMENVFHIVTTIAAMPVMPKLKDYNGAHVEV
ncbi:hypothetical protein DY000_02048786 [Brassica cretica]|uniref:Uncharacterized protein n=1 Tax=Brassica cretica TaxID=69181 RepID=A0ABQ7ESL3_BRACR|nr:hypothetical protein DY000_02048786 [Brassica cretica]